MAFRALVFCKGNLDYLISNFHWREGKTWYCRGIKSDGFGGQTLKRTKNEMAALFRNPVDLNNLRQRSRIRKVHPNLDQGEPLKGLTTVQEMVYSDEEVNSTTYPSIMLNHERRCPDDRASLDYLETKESSLLVVQPAAWIAKKHMHRGMAYEGPLPQTVRKSYKATTTDH
ncbi:hypothetical protein Pfo_003505 [Paulownia fortunei]|nr:hypothetical protein Pfo_003505 [Paulownia fortunei]